EVHLDVFGTGFLASASGQILTTHHVAESWWQDEYMKLMLDQCLEPVTAEMAAYFPGVPHGIAINTEKISSAADVAVVKGNISELGIKQIALADAAMGSSAGGPSCYSDILLRLMQFWLGQAQKRSSPSRPHPKAIRSRRWKNSPAA